MSTENISLIKPNIIATDHASFSQEILTSINSALLRSQFDLRSGEEVVLCKIILNEFIYYLPLIKRKNHIRMVRHLSYNFLICYDQGIVPANLEIVMCVLEWCKKNAYDFDLRFHTGNEFFVQNLKNSYVRKIYWPILHLDNVDYGKILKKNKRYDLRKSHTFGYTHSKGQHDVLRDFYSVYSANMVDIGVPPQSMLFFKKFLKIFGDKVSLIVCYSGNTAIAAGLLLVEEKAELCYAASNKKYHLANYYMYDVIFQWCQSNKLSFCHGRSDEASTGLQFKTRLSNNMEFVYWISSQRYGRSSLKLKLLLKLMTKLANRLGLLSLMSVIHRYIN